MMQKKIVLGYVYALLSAVIYGCMPLMAKLIYADGVNPMTLSFLRNALALPFLALLALRTKGTLRAPLKLLPFISLLSVLGCTLTPVLLFSSYEYIASGTATVLHFVYPAVVVLAGLILLRKRVRLLSLVSVLLCVAGVCLFYRPGAALNLTGSALAFGSGIAFALYVVLLSTFPSTEVSGFLFTFYIAAVSSVILLPLCLATNSLALPSSAKGWLLCLFFAAMVSCCAVVLFQQSAFLIGGERTSILSTLEPVTGVIMGAVVFHEAISARTLLGSALVIGASLLIALADMKRSQNN